MSTFLRRSIALTMIVLSFAQKSQSQESNRNLILEELIKLTELQSLEKRETFSLDEATRLKDAYQSNQLSDENRKTFYKHLLNKTDIREWDVNLKAIILYKLISYDREAEIPAYKIAETGRTALFALIDQLIIEEFAFVDEWKENIARSFAGQGIEKENIQLSDEQTAAAIQFAVEQIKLRGIDLADFNF